MATIRARYEKGVLKPLEPLDLEEGREVDVYVPAQGETQQTAENGDTPPSNTQQDVKGLSSEDLMDNSVEDEPPPPGFNPTLWWIANLHKKFPPGSFDHVPTDMSINIDHYAYGVPKRTEETTDEE